MKDEVIRYDVYDKKDRWVGSYSTALKLKHAPTALEMARINWKQSEGKVIAFHKSGLEEEVLNYQVILKGAK